MTINKEIFRLAIPNILSNISVPLIATVDTGLMGHTSTAHLAAIGSSSMIFNFLYWNFGFLRMGTTGLVAQAHGAEDNYEKSRIFYQSTIVALSIALVFLVFQGLLASLSFDLMNLEGEFREYASLYFYTRIWDAPATIMLYVVMAWFFGNQNAIVPLIITLIVNITNIGLSIFFVKSLDYGIQGVALGSVIANYTGMLIGLTIILFKKQLITIPFQSIRTDLSRFIHVNKNIFIRTLLLSFTFAFLYSQAALYGAVMLSVNVVLLQFLNWMSYGVDGFAYASEALVGKYKGAQNQQLLSDSIKWSIIWGGVLAIIFGIVYYFEFDTISKVFTNSTEVLNALESYRYWIALVPFIAFISYIWDGVFVGLTATVAMRNTMLFAFIIYLGTYFLTKESLGFNGLVIALSAYLISRGVSQTWLFIKHGTELR